jgi:NAD(P)-dependent dehydrogenase (short-subunit alcohol dehydrogenase family)
MISTDQAKVVLITGGTDGLGKAAAILLAKRGYRVIAAGRSASKRSELESLAKSKNLPKDALEHGLSGDDSLAITTDPASESLHNDPRFVTLEIEARRVARKPM